MLTKFVAEAVTLNTYNVEQYKVNLLVKGL